VAVGEGEAGEGVGLVVLDFEADAAGMEVAKLRR
jgi:hypothetical protein